MRFTFLAALLLFAACDTVPAEDLDLGEFRGIVADSSAGGHVFHDASEAQEAGDSMFVVRAELWVSDGEGYRRTHVVLRLPLATPIEAADFGVDGAATAEIVEYQEDGTPLVVETASAGSVGLFRPDHQDRDWFRIQGTVDLTFPSGAVAGEFRAVPRTGRPVSGCDAFGCTYY